MDVLFVGLGSIGTRHLKNLHAVAAQKDIPVRAWALAPRPVRFRRNARAAGGQFTSCPNTPAMMRRSSRTDAPAFRDVTKSAGQSGYSLFIEKPIFERTDRALRTAWPPGQKAWPPPCAGAAMLALKKALPACRCIRPGCCARPTCPAGGRRGLPPCIPPTKDMGGGVTIDLIHEWDYLVELFGKPEKMYNFKKGRTAIWRSTRTTFPSI